MTLSLVLAGLAIAYTVFILARGARRGGCGACPYAQTCAHQNDCQKKP